MMCKARLPTTVQSFARVYLWINPLAAEENTSTKDGSGVNCAHFPSAVIAWLPGVLELLVMQPSVHINGDRIFSGVAVRSPQLKIYFCPVCLVPQNYD